MPLETKALQERRVVLVSSVHLDSVETLDSQALLVNRGPRDNLVQLDPLETLGMLVQQARLDLQDRLVLEDSREVLVNLVRPEHREAQELQDQLDQRAMPDGLDRRAKPDHQAAPVLQVYRVPSAQLVMLVPEVHQGLKGPLDPPVIWDLLDRKVHLEAQVPPEPLDHRGNRDRKDQLVQVDSLDSKDLRESKVTREVQAGLDPRDHLDKRVRKGLRVNKVRLEDLVPSVHQAPQVHPVALGLRVIRGHLDLREISDHKVH